jgi:hypothetical protein
MTNMDDFIDHISNIKPLPLLPGVKLSLTQVYKGYAREMGKGVMQLTDKEKQLVLLEALLADEDEL